MASIERRNGRDRVKYRDPSARQRSRTFQRKAEADRFALEMEANLARGYWLDLAASQQSVAEVFRRREPRSAFAKVELLRFEEDFVTEPTDIWDDAATAR